MARKWFGGRKIRGLSSDSKPTAPEADSEFFETNTKKTFDWSGSAWVERTSGLSATDNITVDSKTQTLAEWCIMQKTKPAVATNLVAVADGKTTATVSYDLIDTDKVSAVKVQYSLDNSSWTTATTTANDTSYQVTGLTQNTDYYFRIYPSNIMGEAGVTTLGSTINTWIAPTVPQSFVASNDGTNAYINLNWSASTSETPSPVTSITYTVERSLNGSTGWSVLTTGLSAITYTDQTNVVGTTYYYRCKSTNSADTSAYSSNSNYNVADDPVTGFGNATKDEDGNLTGYNYYRFETIGNSTFTIDSTAEVRVLVVGGGGGGSSAQNGGGGSGGVTWTNAYNLSVGSYTVTVGGESGTSSFDSHSSTGGTHASATGGTSGTGTLKIGVSGNTYGGYSGGTRQAWVYRGGGGGGATEAGQNGSAGGNGGDGVNVTGMEAVDKYYGGGGEASRSQAFGSENLPSYGAGGQGGGGGGGYQNESNGGNGTSNTGGGAGAGSSNASVGGSGIVLIRVTM